MVWAGGQSRSHYGSSDGLPPATGTAPVAGGWDLLLEVKYFLLAIPAKYAYFSILPLAAHKTFFPSCL